MAKVMIIGDAGCHTGFARVVHSIGDRLVTTHGHDVSVLAINYRGDYYPTSMKLYAAGLNNASDIYGMSRIVGLLEALQPDVVVILQDPQVIMKYLFSNSYDQDRVFLQARPILAYIPVDGTGHPQTWGVLKDVVTRVAMSKFGRDTWMPEAQVVYHGVDADTFRPVTERAITLSSGHVLKTKRDCKKAFGFDPDGFLVLRVDRNSLRKDYPDTVKALWPLLVKHKDIQVHFHCEANDVAGVNLAQMLSRRPELKDHFQFPAGLNTFFGWPEEDLVALYNAADVFVSTTWGEGFGLTLAEAAACGIPIVTQDVSTMPEVVGPGAVLLPPERSVTVASGEDQWLPNVSLFTEAIEKLYLSAGMRRTLGKAGREHVRQFTWDFAAAKFHEFIGELATATPGKD